MSGVSRTIEIGAHVNFRLSKHHRKSTGMLMAVVNGIINSIDAEKGDLIITYTGKIKGTSRAKDKRIARRLIEVVKYNSEFTLPDNLKPALLRQEADKGSWSSSEDEDTREMKRKFDASSDEDEKENRPLSKRSKIDQLWAKATNKDAPQEPAQESPCPTQEPLPPTQKVLPFKKREVLPSTQEALPSTQEALPSTQEALPSTQEALPSTQEALSSTREPVAQEESYTTPSSSPTMLEMSTQEVDARMRALIMPLMPSDSQQASQPASQPLFSHTSHPANERMPSQDETSPPPSPSSPPPTVNPEYSVNLMSDMDQLTEEDDIVMKETNEAESSKPKPKNKGKQKAPASDNNMTVMEKNEDAAKRIQANVTVIRFDKGGQDKEESESGSDTSGPSASRKRSKIKDPDAMKRGRDKRVQNMTVCEANIIDSDGQGPRSGNQEDHGMRRSKRKPKTGLDRMRGERFLYDNNRTCVGVEKVSIDVITRHQSEDIWETKKPTKEQAMEIGIQWYKVSEWSKKKVKLYESDEYDEWQTSQHRSKRKSLRKVGSDDEGPEVEPGTPVPTRGEELGALLDSGTEYEFSEEEGSGSTSSSSDGLVIFTKKQMQRRNDLEKTRLEKSRAAVKSKKNKKKVVYTSDSESDSWNSDEDSEAYERPKKKVSKRERRSSRGNSSKADKKKKSASESRYKITKESAKSSKSKASTSKASTSGSGKSKAGKKKQSAFKIISKLKEKDANSDYSSSDENYQPKKKTPPKSKSAKSKATQNKSSKSKKMNTILNPLLTDSEGSTPSKKRLPAKSSKSKPGESSKSSKNKKNKDQSDKKDDFFAPEKDDFFAPEKDDFFAPSGEDDVATHSSQGEGDSHPERPADGFSGAEDEVSITQASSEDSAPPVVDPVAVAKERTNQIHNQLLLEFPQCDVSVEPLDTNQGEKNLGAGWFIMFEDEEDMMIEGLFVIGPDMVRTGPPTGDSHGLWLTLRAGEGVLTVDNTDQIMCPGVVYPIEGSVEWYLKNTSLLETMRVYFEAVDGQ